MTHSAAAEPAPPPVPELPYRGIEPFRYIDQRIFAARDEETWQLLSSVIIYRGVLLYGDSGAGKSSLVNAGLLAAARRDNFRPERLRVQPLLGREFKVERTPEQFPDRPPFLPSNLVAPGSEEDKALGVELSAEDLYERLKRAGDARAGDGQTAERAPVPLLIFDQFEEFITLFEEAMRGGDEGAARARDEAPEAQRRVLETLSRLLEDDTLPVKLLFVFREDYLAKLSLLFESRPELLDQYVRLLSPRVSQAAEIIRAPFEDPALREQFLASAGGHEGGEITPELAGEIAAQLQERSEGGFVNLSELQIVCLKLWESADPAAFYRQEAGGQIQKVLGEYWSDTFERLPEELHDPAIALLGHMVTGSNTRNIVSEPDLKSREREQFAPALVERALEELVARRLVRREPRHRIYFYEITSEFLVPWIQQKMAERVAKVEADRLAAAARLKLEESERTQRRLRRVGGVLGAVLVVVCCVAVYMLKLKDEADKARREAELAQAVVQLREEQFKDVLRNIALLSDPDESQRARAVDNLTNVTESGSLGELTGKVVAAIFPLVARDQSAQVSREGAELLTVAARSANEQQTNTILEAAEQNAAIARNLPPRAYIKLADESQRPRAYKIAAALKDIGFAIPPVEVASPSRADELRSREPTGGTDPDAVLRALDRADGRPWGKRSLGPSTDEPAGHFEVWFAAEARAPAPTPQSTPTPEQSAPPAGEPDKTRRINQRITQLARDLKDPVKNQEARRAITNALAALGSPPAASATDEQLIRALVQKSREANRAADRLRAEEALMKALGIS
ncbi:MAG TPA: hypothetical protein VEQ42_07085 [Pyrinomonadaceae bacterium]|nr:hypothetical protein [Pyrinomonadaceae bacterium]